MSTIACPSPIAATTFDQMWISSVRVMLPKYGFLGNISVKFHPRSGDHILATDLVYLNLTDLVKEQVDDLELKSVLDGLVTECGRQRFGVLEQTATLKSLNVRASSPTKPVIAVMDFTDGQRHTIEDCYALAATDFQFAVTLDSILVKLAQKANLTINFPTPPFTTPF